MPYRQALVLTALLGGCDDTLFSNQVVEYEENWSGVVAFTYANCRQCHPSVAEPTWPDALEVDLEEDSKVCDESIDCESGTCGDDGTCDTLYVVPNDPQASYFWRVLSEDARQPGDLTMPASGQLPAEQIEFIEEWIINGASL